MSDSPSPSRNGELLWRAVRYAAAIFAGYLFGLVAGTGIPDAESPAWPLLFVLGAVALFLVFRQGAKSQSHAAADAISKANARAEAAAQAVATQTVTIAGGHVAQAQPVAYQPDVIAHSPRPELDQSIWGDDVITRSEHEAVLRRVRSESHVER